MALMDNTNWWDGKNPNSFFPAVYRLGDDSLEGNLEGQHMNLEQRTIRECNIVESILNLPKGARILDCACGYGRHSIELARRGYDVTGVDLCPQFIEEAQEKAWNLPADAAFQFIQADMRALPDSLGDYDACINMFLSFGFFQEDDNLRVLREFHRVIRPGSKLLIHTDVNPDRLIMGCYGDRRIRTLQNKGRLYIDEAFGTQTRKLKGQWTVELDQTKRLSRSYSIRIYTHDELTTLLKTAGFSEVATVFPNNHSPNSGRPPQEVVYVATR